MTFAAPGALLGLLVLPLLLGLYVWVQRRRRRYPLRYSAVSLVREAAEQGTDSRRHLPAAFYLLTVAVLVVAAARPTTTWASVEATGTVILAIDASGSMRSADIAPSRIDAAIAAVHEFVKKEPKGVKIGLVAFSATAVIVTLPTEDHRQLLASVDVLQLGRGTNIGDGLRVALLALTSPDGLDPARASPSAVAPPPPVLSPQDAAASTIVLLSDGAATTGPDPLEVADTVAKAGVKTYTVGLGTVQGGSFQRGGFGGPGGFMRLDEPVLKGIAEKTGGQYFSAQDAKQLHNIYGKIAKHTEIVRETRDVTFVFAAAAMALLMTGLVLGARWFSKLP
jgi:Ca-activated chloride channel family protein